MSSSIIKHNIFWLHPTAALYTSIAIFSIYSLYILTSCLFLFFNRKHWLFHKSNIEISIIAAILQWLLIGSQFWAHIHNGQLLLLQLLWRNNVLFPLTLFFSFQAKGMHILFEVIWTHSISHPAMERSTIAYYDQHKKKTFKSCICRRLKDPALYLWIKKRGIWVMAMTVSAFHIFTTLLFHLSAFDKDGIPRTEWSSFVSSCGIAVSVVCYLMIWCPIMLYYLHGIKDAYGLRRDLKVGMSFGLLFYFMYLTLRHFVFLYSVRLQIPSFFLLMLAFATVHTATVTHPLIRRYTTKLSIPPPPLRLMSLEMVLENEKIAEPFIRYSKSALVYDSISFIQTVRELQEHGRENDPIALSETITEIYKRYIAHGAVCEMNLTWDTVQSINRQLSSRHPPPITIFNEARVEILRLVGDYTFRNFLYSLDEREKQFYYVFDQHSSPP